jgi:hypothetical protein
MSEKKINDLINYFNNAQKIIKDYVLKRNQLDDKFLNLLLNFQKSESQIYKLLIDAREFNKNKRNNYNLQIKKLRKQKIDDEQLWSYLIKENSRLQEPTLDGEISKSLEITKLSLEETDYEINQLNDILEESALEIDEENEIIEELKKLEENKQQNIEKVKKLSNKLAQKVLNTRYYKNQKRIESLEVSLKDLYNNLDKLIVERSNTHKEMLKLYRITRKYQDIKNDIDNELVQNKNTANRNFMLFTQIMSQKESGIFEELTNYVKNKPKPKEIILSKRKKKQKPKPKPLQPKQKLTPEIKEMIRKKKSQRKLMQEKLDYAIKKQKAGKKLNFAELKLILDNSEE